MGRLRTQFTITLNSENGAQLMQAYLAKESFVAAKYGKEDVYALGNAMTGYKYLKYHAEGNILTVYCWVGAGIPIIENGIKGCTLTGPYHGSITAYINTLNAISVDVRNVKEKEVNTVVNDYVSLADNPELMEMAKAGEEKDRHSKHVMSEIGFWLSIGSSVLSFILLLTGTILAYGVIVYIFDIYAACQGIKIGKKAKGIVTIILSVITSVVTFSLYIAANL